MTTPLAAAPLKPSTVLDDAAIVIDLRGLVKDDWIEPARDSDDYDEDTCPVCLLAAINIAAGRYHAAPLSDITLDAAEAVAAILGLDHLLKDAVDVHEAFIEVLGAGWNDAEERTKDDVVRVLRAAAHREREAGR